MYTSDDQKGEKHLLDAFGKKLAGKDLILYFNGMYAEMPYDTGKSKRWTFDQNQNSEVVYFFISEPDYSYIESMNTLKIIFVLKVSNCFVFSFKDWYNSTKNSVCAFYYPLRKFPGNYVKSMPILKDFADSHRFECIGRLARDLILN